MRSKTAPISLGLLALAVALWVTRPAADRADPDTHAAVRAVRDPRAADPPAPGAPCDSFYLLACLGLAAAAAFAAARDALARHTEPQE